MEWDVHRSSNLREIRSRENVVRSQQSAGKSSRKLLATPLSLTCTLVLHSPRALVCDGCDEMSSNSLALRYVVSSVAWDSACRIYESEYITFRNVIHYINSVHIHFSNVQYI